MRLGWLHGIAAITVGAGFIAAACATDDSTCTGAACAVQVPGAPTFDGARWVAPDAEGRLVVGWNHATDDKTPADRMRYRIYATTLQGRALSFTPVVTTGFGVTSATVRVTPSGVPHFIVVRAIDEADLEDANVVERSAVASPDTLPPGFAGISAIRPEPGTGVHIEWEPATDSQTPELGITYEVYRGIEGQAVDFTTPMRSLTGGVHEVTLTDLGAPNAPETFVVRARDRAGNSDGNTNARIMALGPDIRPPTFSGCASVTTTATTLTATWAAATDDHTTPAEMTYDVFVATSAGGQDFLGTPAASVTGATSVTLTGRPPGTTSYVVCRARDKGRNSDGNTAERAVTTLDDAVSPGFTGVTSAVVDDINRTVTLSWTAATDDRTAPADIVYDVYEAQSTATQNYAGAPRASSDPGATSTVVTDLRSRSTLYWVVRARDRAGNHDANLVEKSGTTKVSFSRDVQPVLSTSCAVIGCHVSGAPPGGLNLIPALSYSLLFDAGTRQSMTTVSPDPPLTRSLRRVAPMQPTESYLYYKIMNETYPVSDGGGGFYNLRITGSAMPALATGNTLTADQKALIREWIAQGAQDN